MRGFATFFAMLAAAEAVAPHDKKETKAEATQVDHLSAPRDDEIEDSTIYGLNGAPGGGGSSSCFSGASLLQLQDCSTSPVSDIE